MSYGSMERVAPEEKYFSVNSEVYWFLDARDTLEAIAHEMGGPPSGGWLFVGALCEGANLPGLARGAAYEESVLAEFAAEAKHIVVTAYDDEAFLVWSETAGESPYAEAGPSRTDIGEV